MGPSRLPIIGEADDPKKKLEPRKARQNATKAKPCPEEMSGTVAPVVEDELARSRYVPSEAIESRRKAKS